MNTQKSVNHKTLLGEDYVEIWIEAFLVDRKSQNLAKGTIRFYKNSLATFVEYLDTQQIKYINQITPTTIRDFLLILEDRGHNSGGVHIYYRTVKTFLRWYWEEAEPEGKNPINKVKAPRLVVEARQGITRDEFESLLEICPKNQKLGERDRTILMVLLDTGVRASELCNIRLEEVNLINNSILIKQGKGRKPRFVFIGKTTRKQIRKYLRLRKNASPFLFTNKSGDKLVYTSLRQILRRLCTEANLTGIGLHDFRRAFCLECLRNGIDLLTISRLMGHTSLQLLSRYAKQNSVDLGNKYKSVVDS